MAIMFFATYLVVWLINRFTNPEGRYREYGEYHKLGAWYVGWYMIYAFVFRLIGGDDITSGYILWIFLSGVMVWISTIMALHDSDSGSSLFNR
jgi:hypothetical protein